MHRLYRYVGPPEIAEGVGADAPGLPIRSANDLREAVAALGGASPGSALTVTFVVDALGTLRIADRASEHVACAGGGPVMTAGELGVRDGAVEEASNQSTGFCPEPSSFPALWRALDEAGISCPDEWTAAFEFRRCGTCAARTLLKDGYLECAECGAALPEAWSFDRTRVCRTVVRASPDVWTIDTIEEPSGSDQDRVGIEIRDGHLLVVLADGAGGTSGGAEAAERAVSALASSGIRNPDDAVGAIRGLDTSLAGRAGGETTAVLARMSFDERTVWGASAGDSVGWARAGGAWVELTEGQHRKPLVGRGRARPEAFGPRTGTDGLLVASDGLSKYASWPRVLEVIEGAGADAPWRLVDLARLPSGDLQDDLAVVLVRRLSGLASRGTRSLVPRDRRR